MILLITLIFFGKFNQQTKKKAYESLKEHDIQYDIQENKKINAETHSPHQKYIPIGSNKLITSFNQVLISISPNFTNNQSITITIDNTEITINDSENIQKETFISDRENIFVIQNVKNISNVSIIIKPIEKNFFRLEYPLGIQVEDCDPINIEFTGWDKINEYPVDIYTMFHFYSENQSNLNIKSSKVKSIKYRYYKSIDQSLMYNEFPSTFVFCLNSTECDIPEFNYLDPIQTPCDGTKDLSNQMEEVFDEISLFSFDYLILCLNEKSNGTELNFSFLTGTENLDHIKIINYDDIKINLSIVNFPARQNNEWEIINCTINVKANKNYEIGELHSNNSLIKGDKLNVKTGIITKNVDLLNDDINFTISDSRYWFEKNDYQYKENDFLILKIKSELNSSRKVNFIPTGNNPCGLNLHFEGIDENSTDFYIHFDDKWNNIVNGRVSINVSSNERIIIDQVLKNVDFKVFNLAWNCTVHQIPPLTEQSSVAICYESFECSRQKGFSVDKDTAFVSTTSKENYDTLRKLFESFNNEYKYLRLVFIGEKDPIDFKLNDIVDKSFLQMQFYGYNNARILLEEGAKIANYKSWVINHASFAKNVNIDYTFDELIIIDTEPVFQDVLEYAHKINIETARFYCEYGYKIKGLEGVFNIDYTTFEIYPNLENNNYTLSMKGYLYMPNGNLDNSNGSPLINPPFSPFHFNVHGPTRNTDNTFHIKRYENNFQDISITFVDLNENIPISVRYECDDKECNKFFTYKFKTKEFVYDLIQTHEGSCNNVTTKINEVEASPTQTPPRSQTYIFTESVLFSLSEYFSISSYFSNSEDFTKSSQFSKSSQFTGTSHFTKTSGFTKTTQFTLSTHFTKSSDFTNSFYFTNTEKFTETSHFSCSLLFSSTLSFTVSSPFSVSFPFTDSNLLLTSGFSSSPSFSKSASFSSSVMFTPSYQFTPSYPFQHDQPEIDDSKPDFNLSLESININSNGIIEVDDGKTINLNNSNVPFISVLFKNDITVTESDVFSLPTTLYFIADEPNRRIKFDEKLINSSIGVKTDKSPTVVLTNDKTPLNIMNYKQGYSWIDIEYESDQTTTSLKLNEVNNSNGYLTLNVESNIRSISFTSLIMSRISSIEIKNKNKNQNQNQDQRNNNNNNNNKIIELEEVRDNNICELAVEDNINISSRSSVTLSKIRLEGNINMNDDSIIIFREETKFEDSSNISIKFSKNKDTRREPIIKFDGLLDSTPNQITLSFEDKSTISDLSNFILIEASKFKTCISWIDHLQFVNIGDEKIEAKCKYANGGLTHLVLSTEKSSKKLSAGVIAGIVVAIVAVIVIIIVVTILVRRKKTKKHSEQTCELNDSSF
ncbi:hypothetical protein M9Y10_018963 [Tritrichomonas musculus]|uniref:Uncharacterized protein n=1 Tax=Tritrichomonas musculus TaxID=1915356 RepID=A0ABR2HIB8_9EUKA